MRCAVARASKGYHSFKINNNIYITKSSFIHHSSPSFTSKSKSTSSSLLPYPTQNSLIDPIPTKPHVSISTLSTFTIALTLTCRCIVPLRGIQASNLLYMIWHCAPLWWGGKFPSLAISRERETQFCFPLQNGNGWTLINAHNRRSLFSISWPINPDPIKPKKGSPVQITVDWPIEQLSSRDGTTISVSCKPHNNHIHQFQPHIISQFQYHALLQYPVISQHFNISDFHNIAPHNLKLNT